MVLHQLFSVTTCEIDISLFLFTNILLYATALFSSWIHYRAFHATHSFMTHKWWMQLLTQTHSTYRLHTLLSRWSHSRTFLQDHGQPWFTYSWETNYHVHEGTDFNYCCGRLSVTSCKMVVQFSLFLFPKDTSVICFIGDHISARKHYRPRVSICFFQNWIRKLWILSTVDRVFYPLVLYALYLTVGKFLIIHHVTHICI